MKVKKIILSMGMLLMLFVTITGTALAYDQQTIYRLYNPASDEHLYVTEAEAMPLCYFGGFNNEGIGWYAPSYGDGVVRFYSPVTHEHHYTKDMEEARVLAASPNWIPDNDGQPVFYSDGGATRS